MSITWADVVAAIQGVVHKPAYVLYSVTGAGGFWNTGYGFTLGDALQDAGLVDHQPISYGPNGIPGAFPMQPSIDMGVAELSRQILLRDPSEFWAMAIYSEGAIVGSTVFDLVCTPGHPLNAYRASFLGAVTFGNPRRQAGHTVPGGIDPGGAGIVLPNQANVPDSWWDFAAGKAMVGSSGNDLYTTCGAGENAEAAADQRLIWEIVRTASFKSMWGLAAAIFKILPRPIPGGIAAIQAALNALGFFGIGLTPHTTYQFIQPVAGDPRDCWAMAYDYLASLAAATHPVAAAFPTPATPVAAPQRLTLEQETPMTTPAAPAAPAIDIASIEHELKVAVDGLLKGLIFVQKFEALVPAQYHGALDTAIRVLTVVDGVL